MFIFAAPQLLSDSAAAAILSLSILLLYSWFCCIMKHFVCLICNKRGCEWEAYKSRAALEAQNLMAESHYTNRAIRFHLYMDYNIYKYGRNMDEEPPDCVKWGIRDLYPEPEGDYGRK